jgi:acetyltransferase (GNAT) family protein
VPHPAEIAPAISRACSTKPWHKKKTRAFAKRNKLKKLHALIDIFQRLGTPNALLWLTARAASAATAGRVSVYRYYFVAQPVAEPTNGENAKASSLVIRRIHEGEPVVAQFPRPRHVIAQRFAMNATCIVAEKAGRFVGFVWLKEREYPEDEVRCLYRLVPPALAAWDFDVYIEPAYRVGRTFARLWDAANAWLRERGYRWTISRISAFNPESLAAHRRLGMRTIGSAIFVRISGAQFALLGRAPFVHVGWNRRHVPVVCLGPPKDALVATIPARSTPSPP